MGEHPWTTARCHKPGLATRPRKLVTRNTARAVITNNTGEREAERLKGQTHEKQTSNRRYCGFFGVWGAWGYLCNNFYICVGWMIRRGIIKTSTAKLFENRALSFARPAYPVGLCSAARPE